VAGELALRRVGRAHYEIVANGVFLMATYNKRSERALARQALAAWPAATGAPSTTAAPQPPAALSVLVGGLGVGHTLAAVLADPRVAAVVVVELEPTVVEWNRRYFKPSQESLAAPRVDVVVGDFHAYVRDLALARRRFDLILADTDNGPDWLIRPENHAIYGKRSLRAVYAALTPGGVAGFWSAARAPWFEANLAAAGFGVEVCPVASRRVLPPDVIYLGRKASDGGQAP